MRSKAFCYLTVTYKVGIGGSLELLLGCPDGILVCPSAIAHLSPLVCVSHISIPRDSSAKASKTVPGLQSTDIPGTKVCLNSAAASILLILLAGRRYVTEEGKRASMGRERECPKSCRVKGGD